MKRTIAMMLTATCTLLALLGHLSQPADVVSQGDKKDIKVEVIEAKGIKFPSGVVVVIPMPPAPQVITTLNTGTLYVVEWTKDFILLASPGDSYVKLTKETGPISIHAVFVGGSGKPETKKFAGPCVYLVEAVRSGTVELIAIPSGVTDEATIVRKTLIVGAGPTPPGPDPIPPTPTDPYFPLDGKTRVLEVYDNSDAAMQRLTAAQLAAIEGTEVRKWLDGHAPSNYKIWPSDVKGVENTPPEWQKAFSKAQASKTVLPYVLVSDGKGVEVIQTIPVDGVMPILVKVGGP